jgi:methylmalonyl-CoA mutase
MILAGEFDSTSKQQWVEMVAKVLKGADFDKALVSHTYDGIRIDPLYTLADEQAVEQLPGKAGFTRGESPTVNADVAWSICQRIDHPDPATANAQMLEDLEGGANSLEVVIDAFGAAKVDGVVVDTADGFDRVFDSVFLDLISVGLRSGEDTEVTARWMLELWERRGTPLVDRHGSFGADPLGVLAMTGSLSNGLDTMFDEIAALIGEVSEMPNVRVVEIDTAPFVGAGASEGQELGLMLASAIAVLRALDERGIPAEKAAPHIGLTLSADADVFAGIAKIRAARQLWSHALTVAGIDPEHTGGRISVRSSTRMMSQRDPWVNILRSTAACFAAATGGAAAIILDPFDAALGDSNNLPRRIARNTQLILQAEAHVARVLDPAGGSFYVEHLTEALSAAGWTYFQEVERDGGLFAALTSGRVHRDLAATADRRAKNIATRNDPLTGVTEFPNLDEELPAAAETDRAAKRAAANGAHQRSGSPTTVEPLRQRRLAEDFEALRDRADRLANEGAQPTIFLANLGPVAVHTARATYAKNFFEAGGIVALGTDGFASTEELGAAFQASGATAAVLCSSDAVYERDAEAAAAALRAVGCSRLYLAGNPRDQRDRYLAAGVDEFIHVGVNVLDTLTALFAHLEDQR